jgi:hypothetical protein
MTVFAKSTVDDNDTSGVQEKKFKRSYYHVCLLGVDFSTMHDDSLGTV